MILFYKKNSIIFKFLNKYYKIFLNKKYFEQEISSYNDALLNKNFKKFIHPINVNFLGYSTISGDLVDYTNKVKATELLKEIYLKSNNIIDVNDFINYELIEKTLNRNLIKFKKKLELFKLAKTGSHGDFHDGNIILDSNNEIKFIDWRNYRNNNSILYDIFHNEVRSVCKSKNISWTDAILNYNFPINFFIKDNLELNNIKIFYSLITIDLELTLNKNDYIKLNKFRDFLDKIDLN